ncbi:MAG: glutathione S-transferase C-terminal domain-containing protein [Gammaproteobacteria bacterium]|jgi:glutathione S-transferase
MMHELNLVSGNRSVSAASLTPWLLLKQFDLPFNEISIDLFRDDAIEKLGWFSPSLKVPVLIHNDIKVWDPQPICEYLNESFLEGRGWPSHQKKRAAARSVCAELHGDFHSFKQQWPMQCHLRLVARTDAALDREIARLDSIMSCCRRKFGDGGDYLFGKFSIVDAFLAPFAIALDSHGAQLTAPAEEYCQLLLRNPHVQEWLYEAQLELNTVRFAKAG